MTNEQIKQRIANLIRWSTEALNAGNIELCAVYQRELRQLANKLP